VDSLKRLGDDGRRIVTGVDDERSGYCLSHNLRLLLFSFWLNVGTNTVC
jgi:hypothetical protein